MVLLVVRLLLQQLQKFPEDVRVAVLPVPAPRPVVARVPVGHEDAVRFPRSEHACGHLAFSCLPEPVQRDVLREETVCVLSVGSVARPPRLVRMLCVRLEIFPAKPVDAWPQDVRQSLVLLDDRARVHAGAARYRAYRHAVQVAVRRVLRDCPVRRREAGQDSRHRAGERLAAVRAESAPHRPADGAEPRRRDVADAAALRRDAQERPPAVGAYRRRGSLPRLVGLLRGDALAPVPIVARLRASLPDASGLVRVLLEVQLRRGRVLPERSLPRVAHLDLQPRLKARYPRPEADDLILLRGNLPKRLHVLGADAVDGLSFSAHQPLHEATRSGARLL